MKQRISFLAKYFIFWMITFWFFKLVLIFYHINVFSSYSLKEIFNVFFYGSKLDISFSCYILIFPLLVVAFSNFFEKKISNKIISIYTYIVLFIIALLTIIDLEIFKWWGFRIDSTLIKYLNSPREMMATASVSPIFLLILILISIFSFPYLFFIKFIRKAGQKFSKGSLLGFIVIILIGSSLIIPIRGGLQLSPINQSSVYFSNDQFLNQAAVNAIWNLSYSIIEENHNETNPFIYLSEDEVKETMKSLYPNKKDSLHQVVKKQKINVVFIIWESFTAKTVQSLGGKENITPHFDNLVKEGILFNNIYASGDRSDKGLIAILSSFPAQPITSIMRNTTKAAKLPSLAKSFKNKGYTASFYYGGELEFVNIKSYLINSKYERFIVKEDFDPKDWNSKWGAHDEVVFEKLFNDLHESRQPFFSTIFTLSSHEPFEIPAKSLLPGKDEESLFLSSMHYTDSCLGNFIEKAKKEPWWENTLFIITADHGHRLPGENIANHYPPEFKVPMLWLGGALLKKDTIVSILGSNTDISATLLSQLGMSAGDFIYSKNLLTNNPLPFAYYAFNNGFGFINNNGYYVFDNTSKKYIVKEPKTTESDLKTGKAYLQYAFQDYLNK